MRLCGAATKQLQADVIGPGSGVRRCEQHYHAAAGDHRTPDCNRGTRTHCLPGTLPALATGYGRARLYSGTWALYTEMNVDLYFDWSWVNAGYGYQRVGAFGLNTVSALRIGRTYVSGQQHSWRALADLGAGAPTPWGAVNIYHSALLQSANVYGNGVGRAWQG